VIDGPRNVFADLLVADPEVALIKAELAHAISTPVRARHVADASR